MWVLLALLAALPRVGLVVYPRIAQEGQQLHVECRVPRHPDNRRLEFGLIEWSVSFRDLAGEDAQVIWPTNVHVPCTEQVMAYCRLITTKGEFLATTPVMVVCRM